MKTNLGITLALMTLFAAESAMAQSVFQHNDDVFRLEVKEGDVYELSQFSDPDLTKCVEQGDGSSVGDVICRFSWNSVSLGKNLVQDGMLAVIQDIMPKGGTLAIASPLYFAGVDRDGACRTEYPNFSFAPINFKNNENITIRSSSVMNAYIYDACYEGGDDPIGFFGELKGAKIEKIVLSNTKFKGNGSVGIFASKLENSTLSSVSASNAEIYSTGTAGTTNFIGAIAGSINGVVGKEVYVMNATIEVDPANSRDAYVGCAAGYVEADGYDVSFDILNVDGCDIKGSHLSSAGGFFGAVAGKGSALFKPRFEISGGQVLLGSISVDNGYTAIAGAAVGYLYGDFQKASIKGVMVQKTPLNIKTDPSQGGKANVGCIVGDLNAKGIDSVFVLNSSCLESGLKSSFVTSGKNDATGYIVGLLDLDKNLNTKRVNISGNFYNGETPAFADGIGNFGTMAGVSSWLSGALSDDAFIVKNYRNATTGIDPTTTVAAEIKESIVRKNGVIDSAEMRTSAFAFLMNRNENVEDEIIPVFWYSDGKKLTNGGGDTTMVKRPYEIKFDFGCVAIGCLDQLDASTKESVMHYLDEKLGLNDVNGYVALMYTEKEGKLAQADVVSDLANIWGTENDISIVNKEKPSEVYDSKTEYSESQSFVLKSDGFGVKYYVCLDCESKTPSIVPLDKASLHAKGLNVYALQSDLPVFITSKNTSTSLPNFIINNTDNSWSYLVPTYYVEGGSTLSLIQKKSMANMTAFADLGAISESVVHVLLAKEDAGLSKLSNRLSVFAANNVLFKSDTLQLQMQGLDLVEDDAFVFEKVSLTDVGETNVKKTSLYPYMKIGKFPTGNAEFGFKNTDEWKVYFAVEPSGDAEKLYESLTKGVAISYESDYDVRIESLFAGNRRMLLDLDGLQFMDMRDVFNAVKKYLNTKGSALTDAIYGLYFEPQTEYVTYSVKFNVDEIMKREMDFQMFVSDNYARNKDAVLKNFTQTLSLEDANGGAKFPSANDLLVYRTDECFDNLWTPMSNYQGTTAYDNFVDMSKDLSFTQLLMNATAKPWELTLYPHAKSCQTKPLTLKFAGAGKYGDALLTMRVKWNEEDETVSYPFKWNDASNNYELQIPVSGLDSITYSFTVVVTENEGYRLAENGLTFTAVDENAPDDESKNVSEPLSNNGIFKLNEYGLENMQITVNFEKKPELKDSLILVFDLGMERDSSKVFYISSDDRMLTKVIDKANNAKEKLPNGIYTADQCFDSWTYDAGGTLETLEPSDVIDSRNWDVIKNLAQSNKEVVLHAKWKDASECANYNQWRLNVEHGSVKVVEEYFDVKFKDIYHSFDAANEMLVPENLSNKLSVLAVPEEGYELVTVDVLDAEGNLLASLKNGDQISSEIAGRIKTMDAKFVKIEEKPPVYPPENPPDTLAPLQFAYQLFELSGNTIRLTFGANKPASQEVNVEVTMLDDMGNTVKIKDNKFKLNGTNLCVYEVKGLPEGENLLMSVTLTSKGESPVTLDYNFGVMYDFAEVEKDEWQMLSLAMMNLDDAAWNDDDMAFYWWDESSSIGNFWQYRKLAGVADVDPALGYWYSSVEGRKLAVKPDAPEVGNAEWNLQHVYSGWNLVANPYGWYVQLELQPEEGVQVCRWDAKTGDYSCNEGTTLLKPFEAVWVKVPTSRTMTLPSEPTFVAYINESGEMVMNSNVQADNANQLLKSADADSWSVMASLADKNGKKDRWNVLGAGSREIALEEPPAGMGDRVNLSIVDGMRLLNKSLKKKSSANVYEWDIELNATSNRVGYLSFDGIASLAAQGLKLFVTVDGNTVQMKDGEPLQVSLKTESKVAKVRVAKSAPVSVAKRLDGLRAMPQGKGLLVQFNATAALAGSVAKVDLVNLKGEVVAHQTLKASAGLNSLNLNVARTGAYMLRVSVGSQQAAGKVFVR